MEERRIVTVLFCDVTGSTALAGQLDSEEWAELIAEAFPLLIEPVERYGGTVARLMGDAVLAFFGAPLAREDDPQRAILAGLAILDGLQPFREEIQRDYGQDFNVRIGINTGDVVVGAFGTSQTFEYTAMGDAVNIAARMEQTAAPGTMQVAVPTYRLSAPYFAFEALGGITVRGKDEPIEAYRVLGRLADPVGYRHSLQSSVPTMGRDGERALLSADLSRLREEGHGGVVALIGDAGLGKSRLLGDLRQEWFSASPVSEDSSWIERRLLSFESDVPYVLFRYWIAGGLQLQEDSPYAEARAKITEIADRMSGVDRERVIEAATRLLAQSPTGNNGSRNVSHPDGWSAAGGDPDEFRHELVELVAWICHQWVSATDQVVYVIDDFHWIDPASINLIEPLLERISDLPLLVLLAFRPDHDAPSWQLHQYFSEQATVGYQSVSLAPLAPEQSGELIDRMFEGAAFPQRFRREIIRKIGGNPLFAEELVRSMIEQGVVVQTPGENGSYWTVNAGVDLATVRIPDSLQTLIQGRVDRLDSGARQTLQLAAVIGASFSHRDLVAVSETPEQLDGHLVTLLATSLIRPANLEDQTEYVFHHALIWETVYQSILRRRRRRMHRHIGETLEQRYNGQLNERRLALLSRHFAEAGDERAIAYSIQAGDRAAALYAPAEAVEYYSRTISVAQRLNIEYPAPYVFHQRGLALRVIGEYEQARDDFHQVLATAQAEADHQKECQMLLDIGESWEGIDYQRAGEWYEAALESARKTGDQEAIARASGRIGNWYSNVERIDEARETLLQALEIYQDLDDRSGIAEALTRLGLVEHMAGNMNQIVSYRRQAASIFEELDDQIRLSSTLVAMGHAAGTIASQTVVLSTRLPADEAIAVVERSLQIARSVGWRSGESYALQVLSMLRAWQGELGRALATSQSGLAIASEIDHREWATVGRLALGFIHFWLLDIDKAIEEYEQARSMAEESGSTLFTYMTISNLASALIAAGRTDQAEELLREVPEFTQPATLNERGILYSRGELALTTGNPARALAIVDQLYETAINCSEPADIPPLARLRGQALIDLGKWDEALEALDAAQRGAELRGPIPILWQIHLDLGRLHSKMGRQSEVQREFERARQEIQRLGQKITDSEQRTGFLTRAMDVIDQASAGTTPAR